MVLKVLTPYLFMKGSFMILLLFSIAAFSQKVKINEYDKYIKKWRIETLPVNLKTARDIQMDVSFTATDTVFSLQLAGSGIGTNTVDVNGELVFLLDSDTVVTVKSPSIQSIEYGTKSPAYRHEYVLSFNDMEILSRHNLQALRKYSVGGFDDIYIEKKNESKVRELSAFFITELNKAKLLPGKNSFMPPAFPGGNNVLLSFLNRNLKPLPELKVGETKSAAVQFLVTADGSITDLKMKQSAGFSFDNELLRILKRGPKWKPALKNGRGVETMVTQSVLFYRTDAGVRIQF